MFTNPFPRAFGLDIGDLKIKLVQLRNDSYFSTVPSYRLMEHRSIGLPPGLIVNGELQKPEEVRRRLQYLLQGTGRQKPIKSPWVVACLPETQSFIKLIQTKTPVEKLLAEDIGDLAQKHIPFEKSDDYYIQWQIMPDLKTDDITRILIGAAPKKIADSYTYLLESLGLGVVALEIEALAIARAMVTAQKEYEGEARGLLDIGATRSSFVVYDHDIIQFSTSLSFSGEILTTALAQALHLSYEEAEELKLAQGLRYDNKKTKAWEINAKLVNELVKDIEEAIAFYYSHFPGANRVTRITLCGGGANLQRLDQVLTAKLKILAKPGHPWKNLASKKAIGLPEEKSLNYASAIGLALRAADNPFFTHDAI